jgi:hypothetical protein
MPSTAVMTPNSTALGHTPAKPAEALECWVSRSASSTRRPTTTSAATPTPESTSSTAIVASSRRPARQVIATPAATSRSIARAERLSPWALSS